MNELIVNFLNNNFECVEKFETSSKTKYIIGHIFDDRYMISSNISYIITKRVNNRDLYVSVCDDTPEVLVILNKIKNKNILIPNDKAKMLASITGINTI